MDYDTGALVGMDATLELVQESRAASSEYLGIESDRIESDSIPKNPVDL